MKYEVTIRESLQRTVTVEAESAEQAQAIIEGKYDNAIYVLDADDFSGVEFFTKKA